MDLLLPKSHRVSRLVVLRLFALVFIWVMTTCKVQLCPYFSLREIAPSIAPSTIVKYSSGHSFSLWLTRCLSSLSFWMTAGLKYRSIGKPQILTSCIRIGTLGIFPTFSISARYLTATCSVSASSLCVILFAFRAALTSAPKVSNPGHSSIIAIFHHPCTLYSSYLHYGMMDYAS